MATIAALCSVACTASEADLDRALTGHEPIPTLDDGVDAGLGDGAHDLGWREDADTDSALDQGPPPDTCPPDPAHLWPRLPREGIEPTVAVMPTEVTVEDWRAWTDAVLPLEPDPAHAGDGGIGQLPVGGVTLGHGVALANALSLGVCRPACYVRPGGRPYDFTDVSTEAPPDALQGCRGFRIPTTDEFARMIRLIPEDIDVAELRTHAWFGEGDPIAHPVATKAAWSAMDRARLYDVVGNQRELTASEDRCGCDSSMGFESCRVGLCCPGGGGACRIGIDHLAGVRLVRTADEDEEVP